MGMQQLMIAMVLLISQSALAIQSKYLPDGRCPQIIDYSYYTLCYVPEHRQASWVKYQLTLDLIEGKQKRTNNYRMDPLIEDPVRKSDYRGSGYDRGHLLPAADMKLNHQAMSETFFMTNMSPQKPRFNRRIWAQIERKVRRWVKEFGYAHVVTAGVLKPDLPQIASGVSVPRFYYKVIYFPESQLMKAFLIENKMAEKGLYYKDFLVSVDEVETVTGFDFFSELPDRLESKLEKMQP